MIGDRGEGPKETRGRFGVRDLLRFPANAVIDYLAEDACLLCRRSRRRSRGGPFPEEPARFLTAAVPIRLFHGLIAVTNHPVCAPCASRLVGARAVGFLPAYRDRPGTPPGAPGRAEEPIPPGAGALPGTGPDDGAGGGVPVIAPFMTTDEVLEIVHQLKFNGYSGLSAPVGRAVGWALRRMAPGVADGALVVPTPMNRGSEKRRGFNQAERIARSLAADLGGTLVTGVLLKPAATRRQSLTPREERAMNVQDAFSCAPDAGRLLAGRSVVLVDDLVTSGATAAVCAGALLGAGASSVAVACFGRAL